MQGKMNDQNETTLEEANDCGRFRCMPLILRRRFPLTSTSHKYLDIGISARLGSVDVKIIIGNNKGHQIILSRRMWAEIIENHNEIERFLQSDIGFSLLIHDLNFKLIEWERRKMVTLTSHDTCLYMYPTTLQCLFKIKKCVEHVYAELDDKTRRVSDKYNRFVNIIQIINTKFSCITAKRNAMIEIMHTVSDNSHIDCELLAFAMDNILRDADID